jgi:O-antigen ligase
MLLGSPLLFGCLLLSYRRSFWIAAVLAAILIVLFASTPRIRRVLIPAGMLVALAVWLLANTGVQSNLPVIKRINSISASTLEANAEDRYRIDERANVIAEIERHPLEGIGSGGTWKATAAPLSVEHEEGRSYSHVALLLYWLKLGILGVGAYLALIVGSALLGWRAWRSARDPAMRAFGLASACAVAGLAVMDTTASFTGVEARFTAIFAIQLGLLAILAARDPAELGRPR